jgi:hypothetical protein
METLTCHTITYWYHGIGNIDYNIKCSEFRVKSNQPSRYLLASGTTVKKEQIGVVMEGTFNNSVYKVEQYVVWGLTQEEAIPLLIAKVKASLDKKLKVLTQMVEKFDDSSYKLRTETD